MKKYFKDIFTENCNITFVCLFFVLVAPNAIMLSMEKGFLNTSAIKFSFSFISFVLVSISFLSCLIATINLIIDKNHLEYFFKDKKCVLEDLKNNGIIKRAVNYNIILLVLGVASIIFAFIGGIFCFSNVDNINIIHNVQFVHVHLTALMILHLVCILQIQFIFFL